MYSWSLKVSVETWNEFTWSFKSFDEWKRNFMDRFKEVFWKTFKEETQNSSLREAIYEELLQVRWTWIFSWKDTKNVKIPEDIMEKARQIFDILESERNPVNDNVEKLRKKAIWVI